MKTAQLRIWTPGLLDLSTTPWHWLTYYILWCFESSFELMVLKKDALTTLRSEPLWLSKTYSISSTNVGPNTLLILSLCNFGCVCALTQNNDCVTQRNGCLTDSSLKEITGWEPICSLSIVQEKISIEPIWYCHPDQKSGLRGNVETKQSGSIFVLHQTRCVQKKIWAWTWKTPTVKVNSTRWWCALWRRLRRQYQIHFWQQRVCRHSGKINMATQNEIR